MAATLSEFAHWLARLLMALFCCGPGGRVMTKSEAAFGSLELHVEITCAIAEFRPDLILMDNFLGTTNAGEVMRHLSGKGSFSIPVILFSASPNIEETATRLGLQGYLQKPSSIKEIRDYIAEKLS